VDWDRTIRTIRANLRHYLPEQRTVVPERLIGYGRRQRAVQREVVLCIDQSGSMATSVVYSGVFGAVLASMRSLATSLVVFDTAVVDLTDKLHDPVELLFGTQLGGGTDINRAIAHCQGLITRSSAAISTPGWSAMPVRGLRPGGVGQAGNCGWAGGRPSARGRGVTGGARGAAAGAQGGGHHGPLEGAALDPLLPRGLPVAVAIVPLQFAVGAGDGDDVAALGDAVEPGGELGRGVDAAVAHVQVALRPYRPRG
jgi:hypothetical protein